MLIVFEKSGINVICLGIEWLLYTTRALMSSKQNVCTSSLFLLQIEFSFDTVMSA